MRYDPRRAIRSAAVWRAILGRARADWPFMLAVWLLLATATTMLAAGALYGDTVQDGSLHQAIRTAAPAAQAIQVQIPGRSAEVGSVDTIVSKIVLDAFGEAGGEVALEMTSAALEPTGPPRTDAAAHLTALASIDGIEEHASLTSGSWPEAGHRPEQAVLSEGAAAALGLDVGATVSLADATTPGADPNVAIAALEVVGIFRPDPGDPYWLEDTLDLKGVETTGTITYRGPFVGTREDLLADADLTKLELTWHGVLAVDEVHVEDLPTIRRGLEALPDRVRASMPDKRFVTVKDDLLAVVSGIGRSVLVSRSGVVLLTIQFAVVALYAVLLVGGMLVERRRADVGLMRSRGASTAHISMLAFGEALLLAIPAGLVAPFLAVLVVRFIGSLEPLAASGIVEDAQVSSTGIVVAAMATVVCVVALVVPTLVAETDLARIRASLGRPVAQTLPQRLGIDLVLLVVAVIGLWQLRLYGAPLTRDAQGAFGLDPLLVAAPAFALAAGAVLATRIVPRLAELGEHVLGRRRGLVPPLGARQLARRPLRYTRSALLLMLAAALGTFATAFAATWSQSQVDQAAYRAPAQIQVSQPRGGDIPSWALGSAYRAIPGVQAATPVARGKMDVGRVIRDGDLLVLDPAAAAGVSTLPDRPDDSSLGSSLEAMAIDAPKRSVLPVDGAPLRLGLTIDARLRPPKGSVSIPVRRDARGISGAVVVLDADGRLQRFADRELALLRGTGQRLEIPLSATASGIEVTPAFPLRILAIDIVVSPPLASELAGTIDLIDIGVSSSASGDVWTSLPFDLSSTSWRFEDAHAGTATRIPQGSDLPGRIEIGVGSSKETLQGTGTEIDPTTFRLWATPEREVVPVIASEAFLAITGAKVGDVVGVSISQEPIKVHIVGSSEIFPTLDPTRPSLVASASALEIDQLLDGRGSGSLTTEWWLTATADQEGQVAAQLIASPYSASSVISRAAITHALQGDPVALGFVGALALGAIAAACFAALGFLVSTVVSTRERLGEFALLRALGMSGRQLSGWLSFEEASMLIVGLTLGVGLGLLLAWLVLPFATLNASGGAVIPSPIIVVPWQAVALAAVLAAALLSATVLVVARQVRRLPIVDVLRARDE